jgi:hypothetical protein
MAYRAEDEDLVLERLPGRESPAYRAYQLLRFGFCVVPIMAGIDKFFNALVSWEQYLAPTIANLLPLSIQTSMRIGGALEILAGLLVAIRPRIGGMVVGLWLCGIIVNLLMVPGFYDIALRDFGLALGAFALSRLSIQIDETDDQDDELIDVSNARVRVETRQEFEHQHV